MISDISLSKDSNKKSNALVCFLSLFAYMKIHKPVIPDDRKNLFNHEIKLLSVEDNIIPKHVNNNIKIQIISGTDLNS